jgi:hypothetical protein
MLTIVIPLDYLLAVRSHQQELLSEAAAFMINQRIEPILVEFHMTIGLARKIDSYSSRIPANDAVDEVSWRFDTQQHFLEKIGRR